VPRFRIVLTAALLGLAAPAHAGFFGAETLDGPSADIVRVGGADVARDGGSVVTYVKKVAGIDHVFAVRMVRGQWQGADRLDANLALPSSAPVVGVANRGQAVVAFVNNNQLYATVRRGRDTSWPAPVAIGPPGAASPSVDLSVNGVGYVVWSAGGDVRAATLARTARAWKLLATPVDIVAANDAGSGAGRPVVAASADGTGLAAWGENGHVYARRLLHTALSQYPQQLDVADLGGHVGGPADTPVVDITDDSSIGWVTFRQAFDNNATTRVLARRLVGSIYDPPIDVGAGAFGGEGAASPALDVAGEEGIATFASETAVTHTPAAATIYMDKLRAPFGLSQANAVAAQPAVATGETSQTAVAWFDGAVGAATVNARSFKRNEDVDPEITLSDSALGPADPAAGLVAASDKYGDTVIAFVQGSSGPRQGAVGNRRLVAAAWDRPPVNLIATTTYKWRTARPLGWERVSENWGGITYTVQVDDSNIGTTNKRSLSIAGKVADGVHKWRFIATDRRGQAGMSLERTLRIDSRGPTAKIKVKGRKTPGNVLQIIVDANDAGSGVRSVKVDLGDGSPATFGSAHRHAFARGTYRISARLVDKLGNARVVSRRLKVS
jgi:hypothetical protein